jgi:chondroitin AC lyase
MTMKKSFIITAFLFLSVVVLAQSKEQGFIAENMNFAKKQVSYLLSEIDSTQSKIPHSVYWNGKLALGDPDWWTSGFFPGTLWYLSSWDTSDALMAQRARMWTGKLEKIQYLTEHHDVGFMINCSYGNAYRYSPNDADKQTIIQAARSLSTRFSPKTGTIKSWNRFTSWYEDSTVYTFPVIIDNMMNLELLFNAYELSGDKKFREIAVSHAEKTMRNQVRADGSTFHVTLYDPNTGKFIKGDTSQGYSSNSTWSRGQGWAIYGFTMCYRFTHDRRFLDTAIKCADYYVNNTNLPADKVPWWDFQANYTGYTPGKKSNASRVPINYRDASAAAIVSSALMELSTYVDKAKSDKYYNTAVQMLHSLGSDVYRAPYGKNGGFILMHSTGALPQKSEIDVPLVYADYYFIEALIRYDHLLKFNRRHI